MPFEIIYNTPKPVLITMGQAPKVIEPEPGKAMAAAMPIPEKDVKTCELCGASFHADRVDPLCLNCRAGMELAKTTEPQQPEPKSKVRVKKMADKKLDHESGSGGPEVIRKDDAGEQGAIGTHGENAPAQTKVPQSEGDKEGSDNG